MNLVGQEDCLYLDISAPRNKQSKLLPVMFWIHGGGIHQGAKICRLNGRSKDNVL